MAAGRSSLARRRLLALDRSSPRRLSGIAFFPGKTPAANRPTQPFVCKSCGTASHFFTPSHHASPRFEAEMPSPA
ncbi:hypothetical protein FA258_15750 [Pseudomonas aeruginosa]|nr:hypothetical protein [Pseudomonas aeruginosa]